MNDNVDGEEGAFSIQNIVRMSLIYNKYPTEWHGTSSISNVMRDLNKFYLPYSIFRIVHFFDGMIYLDKILKAGCQVPKKRIQSTLNKDFSTIKDEK